MVHALLPPQLQAAAPELASYWEAAFGHPGRLDYGTGHETTFVAFLYGLARLGLVGDGEREAFVTRVFAAYLALIRKVQITYWCVRQAPEGAPAAGHLMCALQAVWALVLL